MLSLFCIDDVQAKTLKRDQGDQGEKEMKTSVVRKSMSPHLGRTSSTHFLQSTCYMDNQFVAEKSDECCPLQQHDEVVSGQRNLDLSRFVPTALNCTLSGGFWSEIGKLGQTKLNEETLEHSSADDCPEDISIESPDVPDISIESPRIPAASHGSVCDYSNSPKPNSSGNYFQEHNASGAIVDQSAR
jgi:hypothetical protein